MEGFLVEQYNKVVLDLHVLSKLKKGEKIMTKSNKVEICQNTYDSNLRRIWRREGRYINFEYIRKLIIDAMTIVENIKGDLSKIQPTILKELEECTTGLKSLQETYMSDVNFISQTELLITEIEAFVERQKKGKEASYPRGKKSADNIIQGKD